MNVYTNLRIPISEHVYPNLYQVTCIIQEFPVLDFQKPTGYRIVNLFVAVERTHALIILNSGNFMQKRNKRATTNVFACCFILHST